MKWARVSPRTATAWRSGRRPGGLCGRGRREDLDLQHPDRRSEETSQTDEEILQRN